MPQKYSQEFRERALRLVVDRMEEDPEVSRFMAYKEIAPKLGVAVESLRRWGEQAAIDSGTKPGVPTDAAEQIKKLKRENAELPRANEILKTASAFFR